MAETLWHLPVTYLITDISEQDWNPGLGTLSLKVTSLQLVWILGPEPWPQRESSCRDS